MVFDLELIKDIKKTLNLKNDLQDIYKVKRSKNTLGSSLICYFDEKYIP